ncbi:hypothetical protein [Kribbella speibonae]|uniref:Uncharacterized protein n=1 Tax=Kribbella speibonae TaxID=1572660 RepID=A0A4R0J3M7_9ACTN|nr:hypothetical protein [Kribbella speibonae]TCC38826.1 hypothetical protein E0H92_20845 [Kribbella speibonae]
MGRRRTGGLRLRLTNQRARTRRLSATGSRITTLHPFTTKHPSERMRLPVTLQLRLELTLRVPMAVMRLRRTRPTTRRVRA